MSLAIKMELSSWSYHVGAYQKSLGEGCEKTNPVSALEFEICARMLCCVGIPSFLLESLRILVT